MNIHGRSVLIAGAVGGAAVLLHGLVGLAFEGRLDQPTLYGPTQQQLTVTILLLVVTVGLALLLNTAIGIFYGWLARKEVDVMRDFVIGGAISAAIAAFAGNGLVGLARIASVAITQRGDLAPALVGVALGLTLGVAFGAALGGLGAWLFRRFLRGDAK